MDKQPKTKRAGRQTRYPHATAETSTLMVPEFPVALRLQVKAKALLERRPMREVFAELVEKDLAAEGKTQATGMKKQR